MRKLLAIFLIAVFLLIAMPVENKIRAGGGVLTSNGVCSGIEQRGVHTKTYTVNGSSETIYTSALLTWNASTDKIVTRQAASTSAMPIFVGLAKGSTTSSTGKVETLYDFYYKIGTSRTISGTPDIGDYVYVKTRKDKLLNNIHLTNGATASLTVGTSITFTNGSKTVTGVGTSFTTELNVGDDIYPNTDGSAYAQTIATITSDTSLTLDTNYGGTGGADTAATGVYVSALTTNSTETYGGVEYMNCGIGKIAEYNSTDSWIIHISRDIEIPDPTLSSLTVSGNVDFVLGATESFEVDADTTDHTGAYVQRIDVGVNSASVDALRINLDTGTLLSAAEAQQGIFIDANGIASNTNGSFIRGFAATLTHTSTDRADIIGAYILFDGSRDTDDTSIGFYLDGGTTTINSASAVLHGLEIDFASVTDTDYATNEFAGIVIDMPATFQGTDIATAAEFTGDGITTRLVTGTTAASVYNLHAICSADNTAIFIDSGTTNRASDGNLIAIDLDIEGAYSINGIAMTIDFDTTGMGAADVCKGITIDSNETVVGTDGAQFYVFETIITKFATGRADYHGAVIQYDGTHSGGDASYGIWLNADMTLNNASEVWRGIYLDAAGATNTSSSEFEGLSITSGFDIGIDNASETRLVDTTINGVLNFATDAGGDDAYVITLDPAITAYSTGQIFIFTSPTANTGACSLNVNGQGVKSIKNTDGADPANGDIAANTPAIVIYDGSNMILINPVTTTN